MECLVDAGHLRRVFLDRYLAHIDAHARASADRARMEQLVARLVEQGGNDAVVRAAVVRAAQILDPDTFTR